MFFVHKKLQSYAWLVSPGNYVVTFPGTLRVTTAGITDLDFTTPTFSSAATEPLRIFTVQLTGTERNVRMNGQLTAYNTNNNGSTSWTTAPVVDANWRMGGNWNSASSAGNTQNMYEVIFYNTALGTTQRQTIEAYLAQKWGLTSSLPSGHPGLTTTLYGTVVTPVPTTTTTTFSPTSIAGCQLWLDGADQTTITGTTTMTSWRDKSTNGYTANSFVNSVAYPSWVSNVQNGRGAVQYSAGNGTSIANFVLAQTMSIFMVYYLINTTNGLFLEHGPDENASSGFYFYPPGGNNFAINSGTGQIGVNFGNVAIANTWQMIEGINPDPSNSNTMAFYFNGTVKASGATQSGTTTVTKTLYINGRGGANSVSYNAYLGELIIFNTALSATNRQTIESYLAQKWGMTSSLPVGHPGITTPVYTITAALPRQKIYMIPKTVFTSFLPTSITGCSLWLDAADLTSLTVSGGAVSQWNDKSGNANNATQSTSGNQPTSGSITQNGLNVLNLTSKTMTYPTISLTTMTVFCVYRQLDFTSYRQPLSVGAFAFFYANGGTVGIGRLGVTDEVLANYSTYGLTSSVYTIYGGTVSISGSTTTNMYFNGTNVASNTVNSSGGVVRYEIGRSELTNSGYIAEVLLYNSVLSQTNRQTVESYLAQKWGLTSSLPAGHPGLTTTLYGTTTAITKTKVAAIPLANYALITLSSTATTFSYTGADQTFTAPANVYAVVAYIWGAGGGSGGSGQPGGAGAFAQVIVPVTPGQAYTIIVGQGGITSSTATYGGGGLGSIGNARAGGGRSAIRYSSVDIVTLGAGGGAGQDSGSTGGMANWSPLVNSGAGYPSTAAQNAAIVSGKGGTQTAGGAGGAAMGGLGVQYNGGAGGLNYGGSGGVSPAPTGGGGSGYYGGGGGGGGPYYCTGGGGGSSLLNNVIPITGGNSPNSQDQAPGTGSLYYTGSIATGGTSVGGGNGLVVLTYATASSQLQGLLMSRSSTTITMTWSASSYATSYYWALYYNTTNTSSGGALSSYGTTSSATATATIATGGYYYFAVSGLNASGGVSQIAFSTPLLVPQLFSVTSGLLAFFSFDKTIADFQNIITFAVTGSVSYVNGRTTNQAIYLANEANSAASTFAANYLTSSYNLTVPFSVSVWFNPTNTNQGSLLSTYNSTGITSYSVNLYISGGSMSAAYNNIQNVGASTALTVGTWYHAVITVNASNGLTLFVNGSQVGSTITQTPSINGLMIGSIKDGGASYAFSGYMDDYRIYNRVLTGTEISAIYAGTG